MNSTAGASHSGEQKRVATRNSLVYMVGSLLSFAGGVLMLPVYTHALTPAEYGLLETVLRLVGVCLAVGFVGLRQGYLRLYFDDVNQEHRNELASTSLFATFIVTLGVLLPLSTAGLLMARHFGFHQLPAYTSVVLAAWLAFEGTFLLGLNSLQAQLRSWAYVFAQSGRLLFLLLTNFFLLHIAGLGLEGAIIGNVVAALVSGAATAGLMLRRSGVRFSWRAARELLAYGLPYVPLAALTYLSTNADRFALIYFDAITYLGLLALAAKIGEMALSVCVGFIDGMWSPFAFEAARHEDGAARIGRLYTLLIALCVYLAVSVSLAAPLAVNLLANDSFRDAAELVPIVAFGWVFAVAATLSDIGILIRKRTHLKPLIMSVTAAFAILAQVALTPIAGVVGAATATALTNVFMFLLVRTACRRLYPLRTDRRHFLVIAFAAIAAYQAGLLARGPDPDLWRTIVAIATSTLMFLGTMHFARVLRIWELVGIVQAARRSP